MAEFKKGDRVKVIKPGAKTLGKIGTVQTDAAYLVLLDGEKALREYAETSLDPAASTPTGEPLVGLNVRDTGTNDSNAMAILRPRVVRMEYSIARLADATYGFDFYKARGALLQPLIGFGAIPSDGQIDALAAWCKQMAPKGMRYVELGNETWIHIKDQGGPYARQAKRLGQALTGSGVGVLCQLDDNNSGSSWWVDAMAAAVPDLSKYVARWVSHCYGTPSVVTTRLKRLHAFAASHGWGDLKFANTECGLACDGGRNLNDNYGWPTNLTYDQAGINLKAQIKALFDTGYCAQAMLYQSTDQQNPGATNEREHYFGQLQANGTGLKGGMTTAAKELLA
jgi:hypothetical protein